MFLNLKLRVFREATAGLHKFLSILSNTDQQSYKVDFGPGHMGHLDRSHGGLRSLTLSPSIQAHLGSGLGLPQGQSKGRIV